MDAVIGFLVVAALCVATLLLGRSLFAHLRKVPPSFDPPSDPNRDKAESAAAPGSTKA